jgi:hypothetical protein
MLPFLASVIRPPFLQSHNSSNILEQTQAFIRLVCQHKQQQLILQQQQQQQQQWTQHALKRRLEMEDHDSPTTPPKRAVEVTGSREESASQNECANWTVEEVCQFVASVELCKPYVEVRTTIHVVYIA